MEMQRQSVGRIYFLRTAERVLLKVGKPFKAVTFEELFEYTKKNSLGEIRSERWKVLGDKGGISKK